MRTASCIILYRRQIDRRIPIEETIRHEPEPCPDARLHWKVLGAHRMIDHVESGAIERTRQFALGNCETDPVRNALAEGARRRLDAGTFAIFGMARGFRMQLAKVFDVVNFGMWNALLGPYNLLKRLEDMINQIKLGFVPHACCWVHRRGQAQGLLAV
jgi:hypothetical protein